MDLTELILKFQIKDKLLMIPKYDISTMTMPEEPKEIEAPNKTEVPEHICDCKLNRDIVINSSSSSDKEDEDKDLNDSEFELPNLAPLSQNSNQINQETERTVTQQNKSQTYNNREVILEKNRSSK